MSNTIVYHVGDVREAMRHVDDGMVGLVITSPPFLALRSYLPDDHPDKHREIGSEATPAAFLDTMLGLTADWRRIVAPWGSIAVEIGDTYAGSGSPGGDYSDGGMRAGQPKTTYSGSRSRPVSMSASAPAGAAPPTRLRTKRQLSGWPLDKSLCMVPTLYPIALAYGLNPLTGAPSPAGEWRIRNLLTWTRPNPPVGALGDKFRPATSFVTVACVGGRRWFDLDAVRSGEQSRPGGSTGRRLLPDDDRKFTLGPMPNTGSHEAGAPPLDWWDANDLDDDDLAEHWQPLHRLSTSPYRGAHYATFPVALPQRLIEAMCPREVCTVCGEPRRRLTKTTQRPTRRVIERRKSAAGTLSENMGRRTEAEVATIGWTDCGHDAYTAGIVLDPFGGSGTTAVAAARAGRDSILIDLDARNRDLARQRITDTLRLVDEHTIGTTTVWTVEPPLPLQRAQAEGQRSIFDELEAS